MPVVDSLLNEEKIEQLLAEGGESETLDYKRTLDLSQKFDQVELAKDIAAMQVDGGYIVVGADDNGKPTGELTESQTKLFDESRLRSKLLKYLPAPFDLQSCTYEREGNWIAAIVTQPNPSGFMIMQADGQYGSGKGNTTVFRKGDIFVRHGTASERWSQHDIERILKRVVAARKEEWRRENTEGVLSIIQAEASARTITQGSASSFTWRLDAQAFDDALVELLRAGDILPIRILLDRMSQDTATLIASVEGDPLDEMRTLLNRLACLSANFLRFNKDDLFALSIRTFVLIYSYGFDVEGSIRSRDRNNPLNSPRLWLEIIERVVALGAYAVRLEEWEAVRTLTLQIPQDTTFFYYGDTTPWIRNAITKAANAHLFAHPQTNVTSMGELISLANRVVDGEPCLRPDLIAGDDHLLNSILQFDLLSVLVVSYGELVFNSSHAYPSFIFWDARRSEPALIKLLSDNKMLEALFGIEIDLAVLAGIVRRVDKVGDEKNFRWDNWRSKAVNDFLKQYLPTPE
jgi:hypothetical protein